MNWGEEVGKIIYLKFLSIFITTVVIWITSIRFIIKVQYNEKKGGGQ